MVKALAFKGDKPAKKRKRPAPSGEIDNLKRAGLAVVGSRSNVNSDARQEEPPADDDNWVSAEALADITGPVMLVLPTTSPITCLATDSMGKVFASPVENMVEDAPSTAEPHLVSQVWVATRVVGSEDQFTLKGHHGRYLGIDKYGICSAMREAISQEETLTFSRVEGEAAGVFDIQTTRKTYITVSSDSSTKEVRGDADESSEQSRVRVRMQARFKPKHKEEKAEKVRAKISRKELEAEVGRKLEDEEARTLKRARREGTYHEALLDVKVKGKHDKFA